MTVKINLVKVLETRENYIGCLEVSPAVEMKCRSEPISDVRSLLQDHAILDIHKGEIRIPLEDLVGLTINNVKDYINKYPVRCVS